MRGKCTVLVAALALSFASCSGGSSGSRGSFQLVEFLSSGLDEVARNRVLTFLFTAAVAPGQDFFERIKIQNIQPGANPNFSQALGDYILNADRMDFFPRLPARPDRSDSGLRPLGSYRVFLKSGPDALLSVAGDRLGSPQEFTFNTSEFFDDPFPTSPPRATALTVRDNTTIPPTDIDISRQTTSETLESAQSNTTLFGAGQVINPGAGADFATPWEFRLECTEPIDPETVNGDNIQLIQVREDALDGGNAPRADDGTASFFRVPLVASVEQSQSPAGFSVFIVIRPLYTLADDGRYRLVFSGSVRGLDTRQTLLANNGLTGDGLTVAEPGGAGYFVEFLVFDRGQITTTRTVEFDPLVDGIQPETENEDKLNTAVYSPVDTPGLGIGALQTAFGDGSDQDFGVSGGATVTLNTGDEFNTGVKNNETLTVLDPNVNDEYVGTPATGNRTFPNPTATEFNFTSFTVSTGSTLRVVGVNPAVFRVSGLVQIAGQVLMSGENGRNGGIVTTNPGGAAGPGGFPGGRSRAGGGGQTMCNFRQTSGCSTYQNFLNNCAQAQVLEPLATNGEGPGRGMAGGNVYVDESDDMKNNSTASGGGGGGHGTAGTAGTDRANLGGAVGTAGPACSSFVLVRTSGVIGVRSRGGRSYGDRAILAILLGGSGGGGGGAIHSNNGFQTNEQAGGSGGGGGGVLLIFGRDDMNLIGGAIRCRGGAGGNGDDRSGNATFSWDSISGPGGGGAGGLIALISGGDINLSVAILDVRGGAGGITLETEVCNNCNDGGDGGRGFIFLMDEDGVITGLNPGTPTGPGEFDNFATGVLTISAFDIARFGALQASTQLFSVRAANPRFRPAAGAGDYVATPNQDQTVFIFASSAKADPDDPLISDGVEAPEILLATVTFTGQPTVTIGDDPGLLNTPGDPDRREFVRVRVAFDYLRGVEAAKGPQATVDRVVLRLDFN